MRTKNFLLTSLLIALISNSSTSQASPFYEEKEKGWFWHETEVEPETEEEVKAEPPKIVASVEAKDAKTNNKVVLDVDWLRQNFPKLRDAAINRPTIENLASVAYANRLMNDFGSRFSSKMMEFMMQEPLLDENNRRPTSGFAVSTFKQEVQNTMSNLIDKVSEKKHIWFFYSSTCQYCLKQIPILNELSKRTNLQILAISMDGGVLPGLENIEIVFDERGIVTREFNVQTTPTMFLMDNLTGSPIPLAVGMHSLPQLQDRILYVAKESEVISKEDYALSRSVREINVFHNKNGDVVAEKDKLDKDPGYLADLLRAKLQNFKPYGANQVERGSGE